MLVSLLGQAFFLLEEEVGELGRADLLLVIRHSHSIVLGESGGSSNAETWLAERK